MEIQVENKKWTVIKEYPKKRREKDLLLCVDKYGIRECFLRCQIDSLPDYRRVQIRTGKLTEADIESIGEDILNGASRDQIKEKYSTIPINKLLKVITQKRAEYGIKSKHSQDGTLTARQVLQYDKEMNFISKYPSAYRAQRETGEKEYIIKKICNHAEVKKSKFIWRWADDQ